MDLMEHRVLPGENSDNQIIVIYITGCALVSLT